ncbi:hypothetical protein B0O99DRAFT_593342 [Bisporella sp. PMI_857]|nr:hypothetical protein B0O99DRAFT_593342 [Bisporella sp. PMI_857]
MAVRELAAFCVLVTAFAVAATTTTAAAAATGRLRRTRTTTTTTTTTTTFTARSRCRPAFFNPAGKSSCIYGVRRRRFARRTFSAVAFATTGIVRVPRGSGEKIAEMLRFARLLSRADRSERRSQLYLELAALASVDAEKKKKKKEEEEEKESKKEE